MAADTIATKESAERVQIITDDMTRLVVTSGDCGQSSSPLRFTYPPVAGWLDTGACTAAGGWWTGSARSVSLFHAPQKSPNSSLENQRSFVPATWRVSTSRAEIGSRCGGRQDRSRSIVVITNSVSSTARDDFAFTSPTGRRPAGDV